MATGITEMGNPWNSLAKVTPLQIIRLHDTSSKSHFIGKRHAGTTTQVIKRTSIICDLNRKSVQIDKV